MSQRRRGRPRCEGCGLIPELCACAELPRVEVRTPLVVVQHVRELFKPTNTARLLTTMAPSVATVHYPLRDRTFDERPFDRPGIVFATLYPREDAEILSPPGPGDPPRGFAILDGTWHQCSRMTRRVPRVQDFPCVALPPGRPSIWRVRTQHDERGMSTFEAAVRLLELMEGPEVAGPLYRAFALVTARALYMKGKLPSPEVPRDWQDAAS